ncbi:MAG: (d)CMP kinase [Candidatus Neomarinimicrobiota bacterium]|nr:MAG: cytidylate kinase [Candidatus Marinimicrobia bacterium TMED108]RCL90743.1 MAG: (d)CMP kinase [bacterium]|tara:strand:- start:371 stop:1033 length:663 start_codon:yes stop_codon:yes gene_type:complete
MIIAIDGPAASGKSTSARLLADELDFLYLDTGAMYRCIALSVTENKVDIYNQLSLESFIGDFNLELHTVDGISDFLINGASVSEKIRTNAVSKKVSEISAIPMIRKYMVKMQREFAKNNNCVVEGRDIGTVVFPQAEIKFFITASVEVRAKRRQLELQNIGDKIALKDLQDDIRARDRYDSERAHSPLKKAFDAIEIDTTEITIDEQVRYMIKNVKLNNK